MNLVSCVLDIVPPKNGIFSQPKDLYRFMSGPTSPFLGSLESNSMAKVRLSLRLAANLVNSSMAFSSFGEVRRMTVMAFSFTNSLVSGPVWSVHICGVVVFIAWDAILDWGFSKCWLDGHFVRRLTIELSSDLDIESFYRVLRTLGWRDMRRHRIWHRDLRL